MLYPGWKDEHQTAVAVMWVFMILSVVSGFLFEHLEKSGVIHTRWWITIPVVLILVPLGILIYITIIQPLLEEVFDFHFRRNRHNDDDPYDDDP